MLENNILRQTNFQFIATDQGGIENPVILPRDLPLQNLVLTFLQVDAKLL